MENEHVVAFKSLLYQGEWVALVVFAIVYAVMLFVFASPAREFTWFRHHDAESPLPWRRTTTILFAISLLVVFEIARW